MRKGPAPNPRTYDRKV